MGEIPVTIRLQTEDFDVAAEIAALTQGRTDIGAVVNFVGIAWLVAHVIQLGWAKRIARALPWVGVVGRNGLVCFVAGAVISLVVDSVLYWYTNGYLNVPAGLVADAVALGALLFVAQLADLQRAPAAVALQHVRTTTRDDINQRGPNS